MAKCFGWPVFEDTLFLTSLLLLFLFLLLILPLTLLLPLKPFGKDGLKNEHQCESGAWPEGERHGEQSGEHEDCEGYVCSSHFIFEGEFFHCWLWRHLLDDEQMEKSDHGEVGTVEHEWTCRCKPRDIECGREGKKDNEKEQKDMALQQRVINLFNVFTYSQVSHPV